MKKSLIIAIGFIFISGSAFAASTLDFKDETTKISYSLGFQIGGDFKKQNVDLSAEAVVQGIQDALAAKEAQLSPKEMGALLVALKEKVVAAQQQEAIQASQLFLAENLKKEGVKELSGGIQYRVIQAGSGAMPSLEDTVDIHFLATHADGTLIATTHTEENKPRPYQVKKTLPALQQALLKMQPGAKWEIVIPPSSRNELTEKGGILIYELELVSIHPTSTKGS